MYEGDRYRFIGRPLHRILPHILYDIWCTVTAALGVFHSSPPGPVGLVIRVCLSNPSSLPALQCYLELLPTDQYTKDLRSVSRAAIYSLKPDERRPLDRPGASRILSPGCVFKRLIATGRTRKPTKLFPLVKRSTRPVKYCSPFLILSYLGVHTSRHPSIQASYLSE